ncbi:MAG TPA: nitroreductase family protein [Thermogutta sp.]|nr:nitroreductase family protein [Thermogutta sp.]HOP78594.1 nitroreductase family protein [Thermogutta sp.]HPU07791.1 nitroreductase family protein [Thermogutta sp.]HPZ84058.1 nitroreductase family protein [Thermogutta sp.]HQF13189.1 nitroreductase family protein [Thermogutta sp.]
MDVFEAINKRYSYRGPFRDVPVPREHLRKIVEAGIRAPSGKNAQTTSFVIVDDPVLIRQIAALFENKPVCSTAKAMIVCVTDPRPVMGDVSFHVEDCAAAVENILLAITALGYATVWIDGALRYNRIAERIGELLGIPSDRIVRVLLPVGVPAEPGTQREKLPFEQRAWFNGWKKS